MHYSCHCRFSFCVRYASFAFMALGNTAHCYRTGDFYLWHINYFSTLNLFFRDLERFVTLGIMLMFYCTPILYASDMIPAKYSWVIDYNPLASMILSWRNLFMDGVLNYEHISVLYLTGIVLTVIGLSIFNKLKYRFAEIL